MSARWARGRAGRPGRGCGTRSRQLRLRSRGGAGRATGLARTTTGAVGGSGGGTHETSGSARPALHRGCGTGSRRAGTRAGGTRGTGAGGAGRPSLTLVMGRRSRGRRRDRPAPAPRPRHPSRIAGRMPAAHGVGPEGRVEVGRHQRFREGIDVEGRRAARMRRHDLAEAVDVEGDHGAPVAAPPAPRCRRSRTGTARPPPGPNRTGRTCPPATQPANRTRSAMPRLGAARARGLTGPVPATTRCPAAARRPAPRRQQQVEALLGDLEAADEHDVVPGAAHRREGPPVTPLPTTSTSAPG